MRSIRGWKDLLKVGSNWYVFNHQLRLEFIYVVDSCHFRHVTFRRGCGGHSHFQFPPTKEITWYPEKEMLTVNRYGLKFLSFKRLTNGDEYE